MWFAPGRRGMAGGKRKAGYGKDLRQAVVSHGRRRDDIETAGRSTRQVVASVASCGRCWLVVRFERLTRVVAKKERRH